MRVRNLLNLSIAKEKNRLNGFLSILEKEYFSLATPNGMNHKSESKLCVEEELQMNNV
jgi:hypothetical protein